MFAFELASANVVLKIIARRLRSSTCVNLWIFIMSRNGMLHQPFKGVSASVTLAVWVCLNPAVKIVLVFFAGYRLLAAFNSYSNDRRWTRSIFACSTLRSVCTMQASSGQFRLDVLLHPLSYVVRILQMVSREASRVRHVLPYVCRAWLLGLSHIPKLIAGELMTSGYSHVEHHGNTYRLVSAVNDYFMHVFLTTPVPKCMKYWNHFLGTVYRSVYF